MEDFRKAGYYSGYYRNLYQETMTLLRLLILAVAIWLLYRMYKNYRARRQQQRPQARVGNMVACAYCGLHLPENEAIRISSNESYCSQEHQNKAQQK